MKTEEFIQKWCNDPINLMGVCASMRAHRGKLFSYNTCIVQHKNNITLFNVTKYSQTTSKHQSMIERYIGEHAIIEGVPRDTQDLFRYIGE